MMNIDQPIAVLSDFDGTITIGGVTDLLYHKFANPSCWDLVDRWIKGEISTLQEMQGCFSGMSANRKEMEDFLDSVQIDPDFPEFVHLCQQKGYAVAVLSDGLRWYIEYIFNRYAIEGLNIFANEITFFSDHIQITTPWYDPATPLRGVSKPGIIKKYRAQGYKVIFIGDGLSDIEAVCCADLVYASSELLAYCLANNIPVTPFTKMKDLLDQVDKFAG
jgi:2-hydroxy-3-keto-5-methylthiopentenyl-1-phosphate phosphatase